MCRRLAAGAAALALVGLASAVTATTASAGVSVHVTVNKLVIGTAPAGTTFTIPGGTCSNGTSTFPTMTFDSHGNPTSTNSFNVPPPGSGSITCTLAEAPPDGVNPTAYTCATTAANVTCAANTVTVPFNPGNGSATINVINTYLPPLTVAPVPVAAGAQDTVSGQLCTKQIFGGSPTTGGHVSVTIGFTPPINLTTTAGSNGSWSVSFTVPPNTVSGPYPVTATCNDPVPYPASSTTVIGAIVAVPRFTG